MAKLIICTILLAFVCVGQFDDDSDWGYYEPSTATCDKSSPIKFYYNDEKVVCYAVHEACYQGSARLFSTEEECTQTMFPNGRRRTINVQCENGRVPVTYARSTGEQVAYLFPADCVGAGHDFCPDNAFCYVGPHGYCCQEGSGNSGGRYVFQKNFGGN